MYRDIVLALLLIVSILIGSVWIGYATVTSQDIVEITSTAGDYNTTHYIFHLKVEYPAGSGNIYEAYAFMPKNLSYLEPFTLYLNWSFSGSDMHDWWVFVDSGTYTSCNAVGEKYIRYDGWWEHHPSSPWNASLYIKFDDYFNGPMAYTPGVLVSFTVPDTATDNSEAVYKDLILRVYSPDETDICRVFVNDVKVFETQLTIYYRHHIVDWWNRYVQYADLNRAWMFIGESFDIYVKIYDSNDNLKYSRKIVYTASYEDLIIKASYKKPLSNYPRLNIAIYDNTHGLGRIFKTYEVTFLSPSYLTVYPKNPDPYTSYKKKTPFTLNVTKGGFWDTGGSYSYGVQLTIIDNTWPKPNTISFRIEKVYDYNGNPVIINKTYTLSLGESSSSGDTTTTTTTSGGTTTTTTTEEGAEEPVSQMVYINDTMVYVEAQPMRMKNGKIEYRLEVVKPKNTTVVLDISGKGTLEISGYGTYPGKARIVISDEAVTFENSPLSLDYTVSGFYELLMHSQLLGIRTRNLILQQEGDSSTLTIYTTADTLTITLAEVIVNGTSYVLNETIVVMAETLGVMASAVNIGNAMLFMGIAIMLILFPLALIKRLLQSI